MDYLPTFGLLSLTSRSWYSLFRTFLAGGINCVDIAQQHNSPISVGYFDS